MRKFVSGIAACYMSLTVSAQTFPQGYFRNPLDIPILLAGNFGECRPNHFHTGLDIKTNGKENLPVRAAADGYVSRISVSHSGYGNCLYITHPNGYVTVYAHLNDFYKPLMDRVRHQQYEKESWNIDMQFLPIDFPVKKGELIAYSGNTGGSTAPHLHFEVRDAKTEHVLNGGLFGFQIKDNLPPVAKNMVLYGAGSIYLQTPKIIGLTKSGAGYTTADVIVPDSKVMIGVLADDKMEGSANVLGVYSMALYMDEQLQASWKLSEVDFAQNRYVNAFADYRLKEQKGQWYELLYRTPHNRLEVYDHLNAANGMLDISDQQPHRVRIEMKDFSGNISFISFNLKCSGKPAPELACNNLWMAEKAFAIDESVVDLIAGAGYIYDDLCFDYKIDGTKGKLSPVVQISSSDFPLQGDVTLAVKLNQPLPFSLRSKIAFVHHVKAASLPGNNPQSGMAAVYEDGHAKAPIRTFGNFYAMIDTVAPVITVAIRSGTNLSAAKSISFTVKESITSVAGVRPELNGKWLRFVRRGDTYTYIFDEYCSKGENTLTIRAWDENNNESIKTITFTR